MSPVFLLRLGKVVPILSVMVKDRKKHITGAKLFLSLVFLLHLKNVFPILKVMVIKIEKTP